MRCPRCGQRSTSISISKHTGRFVLHHIFGESAAHSDGVFSAFPQEPTSSVANGIFHCRELSTARRNQILPSYHDIDQIMTFG